MRADRNQILSEAVLGWGTGMLGFGADQIRNLVSMTTDSSDRVIIGKTASSRFLKHFFIFSYLQVMMAFIRACMSSKSGCKIQRKRWLRPK